jgi:hypothetical protein
MLNSYFPRQHSRRSVPLLTSDEVRPIAANTAKLPWLPKRRDGLEKDEAEGATPGFSASAQPSLTTATSLSERLLPLAPGDVTKVVGRIELGAEDLPCVLFHRPVHFAQSCRRYSERDNVPHAHRHVP